MPWGGEENCGIKVSVVKTVDTKIFDDVGLHNKIVNQFTVNFLKYIFGEVNLIFTSMVRMEEVGLIEIFDNPIIVGAVKFYAWSGVKYDVSLVNI